MYVAAYSVFYFCTKLEIDEFVPTLLYFSYTLIMVATFWLESFCLDKDGERDGILNELFCRLLTGTIGFYAAYFFNRKIYSAVKID